MAYSTAKRIFSAQNAETLHIPLLDVEPVPMSSLSTDVCFLCSLAYVLLMADQAPPPHEDPSTPRPLSPTQSRVLLTVILLLAMSTAIGSAYFLVSTAESALEDVPPDSVEVVN